MGGSAIAVLLGQTRIALIQSAMVLPDNYTHLSPTSIVHIPIIRRPYPHTVRCSFQPLNVHPRGVFHLKRVNLFRASQNSFGYFNVVSETQTSHATQSAFVCSSQDDWCFYVRCTMQCQILSSYAPALHPVTLFH